MYVADGYSVQDPSMGECLFVGKTRESCERMINRMGWRNIIITKRKRLMTAMEHKLWKEKQAKFELVYVARREVDGYEQEYRSLSECLLLTGLKLTDFYKVVKRRKVIEHGRFKGWRFSRKLVDGAYITAMYEPRSLPIEKGEGM